MISGRALGLIFLGVTSASWIGASFITQKLVSPGEDGEEAAVAPWLLTLICSSTLMLYLPIGHFARKRARYEGRGSRATRSHRPRNRPRKGPPVGANGEVTLESSTGSMLPRRRAAAAAAAASDGVIGTGGAIALSGADPNDHSDNDGLEDPDAETGHTRGWGPRGSDGTAASSRSARHQERQPLLHGHGHGREGHKHQLGDGAAAAGLGHAHDSSGSSGPDGEGSEGGSGGSGGGNDGDVSTVQIVWAAIVVAPVWFAAQLAFTASLEFTSVTSNTVLSSCSSLFVYLGSLALGQEVGSALRLGSVVAAMGGTTLVALGDRRSESSSPASTAISGSNPLLGDALTLMAAALYAMYTIMMKRMLVKDDGAVMALFFGTIGVLYFSVLAPLAGGLALAGADVIRRVTSKALMLALVQGLVDYVAADYAWARAVMLLGPTATSCGLAMQIPAAGLIDAFINGNKLSWSDSPTSLVQFIFGSCLIICGFIGVSLDPRVALNAWNRVTECFVGRPTPSVIAIGGGSGGGALEEASGAGPEGWAAGGGGAAASSASPTAASRGGDAWGRDLGAGAAEGGLLQGVAVGGGDKRSGGGIGVGGRIGGGSGGGKQPNSAATGKSALRTVGLGLRGAGGHNDHAYLPLGATPAVTPAPTPPASSSRRSSGGGAPGHGGGGAGGRVGGPSAAATLSHDS